MLKCAKCGGGLPLKGMTCPSCGADTAIWVARAGQVYGPYDVADLGQALREGRIGQEDQVMVGTDGQWQPATVLQQQAFAPQPVTGPPARPPSGGGGSGASLAVVIVSVALFIFLALGAIVAAILFPVFARAREKARQTSCLSNLKQISLASLMYAQDHSEVYLRSPATPRSHRLEDGQLSGTTSFNMAQYYQPDDWQQLFNPYIKNQQVFVCPVTMSAYSYEFNAQLYGLQLKRLKQPATTAMVYDAGFPTGSPPGPHNKGYNAGFCDGHCKWQINIQGATMYPE